MCARWYWGGGILALTKWMPLEKTVPVSAEPEQEETVITVGSAGDIILHRPFLYFVSIQKRERIRFFIGIHIYQKHICEVRSYGCKSGNDSFGRGGRIFRISDVQISRFSGRRPTGSGADLFLLANNHIYDGGASGFLRTSQYLSDRGILYTEPVIRRKRKNI